MPFTADDFRSAEERRRILDPMPVTDPGGRVLPMWRRSQTVYLPKAKKARRAIAG